MSTTAALPEPSVLFGPITQIAWVTDDLDAAESMLGCVLGVKKWTRIPDVPFTPRGCTYRGEPADFTASISLAYLGDMRLELIEPRAGESIYTEFLAANAPCLHHICVEPSDFDAAVLEAGTHGTEVIQQGTMLGGMRFAYVSAPRAALPYIEFAEIPAGIRAFYDQIKGAQA